MGFYMLALTPSLFVSPSLALLAQHQQQQQQKCISMRSAKLRRRNMKLEANDFLIVFLSLFSSRYRPMERGRKC